MRAVQHEAEMLDAALRVDDLKAMAKTRGLDRDLVARGDAELSSTRLAVEDVMAFLAEHG